MERGRRDGDEETEREEIARNVNGYKTKQDWTSKKKQRNVMRGRDSESSKKRKKREIKGRYRQSFLSYEREKDC